MLQVKRAPTLDTDGHAYPPGHATICAQCDRAVWRRRRARGPPVEREPLGATDANCGGVSAPPGSDLIEADDAHFKFLRRSTERSFTMKHIPLGPNETWKTGQRVPASGDYADQYGIVTFHQVGATFPPCVDRKGECAYRFLVRDAAATA